MAEKVVGGLKWVKSEIAATLRRVTERVEVYGQTSESGSLGDAVDALFEIRGVLLALQLTLPVWRTRCSGYAMPWPRIACAAPRRLPRP
ncbi:MAG: hypothetical protein JZU52_03075 [Lamprocystis purpurea]|nr:hypothetical protein [Lamprocystis purpurea]